MLTFRITADKALFTDPLTRIGGEKCSYEIPTYGALVGVCKAIYWKPTFLWVVDKVRIMNPIELRSEGVRLPFYGKEGTDLAYFTYLQKPTYEVCAHIKWNYNRPEFEQDRQMSKHAAQAEYYLNLGGRRDAFLGTKECLAYVEPCEFGKEKGFYDNLERKEFGIMYHSTVHPDEAFSEKTNGNISVLFYRPVMKNGVIYYPAPNAIPDKYVKTIRKADMKFFPQKEEYQLKEA